MSDIFISYARQDRPKAQVLAQALMRHGWSVWWDRTIPTGKRFDQVIQEALAEARCVLVLWSKQSIASDWVLEEAEEGRQRQILVPVFIEDVPPPLGFRRIQAADLTNWDGTGTVPPFQRLVADIAGILGPPVKTEGEQVVSVETKEAGTAAVEPKKEAVPAPPEAKPPAEPPPAPFRPLPVRKVLPWFIGGVLLVGMSVAFWVFQGPKRVLPGEAPPKIEVVIPDPRIESFRAKPQVLIKTDEAILYWKTSGAVEVEISGIGRVPLSGEKKVTPKTTTSYTLVARNEEGKIAKASAEVRVPPPGKILHFSVSPQDVVAGQKVSLCYGVADAASARIDPTIGHVSPVEKGCVSDTPKKTTTYTLIAVSRGGYERRSTPVTVMVTVTPPVVLSRSTFRLPEDGIPNQNKRIGPFCCTGKTAIVYTTEKWPVGYIYFYDFKDGKILGGRSFAMELGVLVSGLANLDDLKSTQQQSAVFFRADEMRDGAWRSTRAGDLNFRVTIERVVTRTIEGRVHFEMGSVEVRADVSAIGSKK